MLPAILVLVVAFGVVWPFLKQRGLIPDSVLSRMPRLPFPRPAADPAAPGAVVAPSDPREALCPRCSRLNMPGAAHCADCGALLPVDKLSALWADSERQALVPELVQCGALLGVMVVAMILSYNLPLYGKLAVLLVTVGGLAFRFSKAIQG